MAFGTPWAVGGGAQHEVGGARQQAHDSTGGGEGISRPGDRKGQPLATPGAEVRVAPGGALMVNRFRSGQGQSYTARNDVEVEVPVTATGSAGGRSDLVVARVLDPQYEGQPPADPNDFDYSMVEIIEGVSSSTTSARDLNLNYPAIGLARIDLPASTGTVEAAHLTDLREMARPRKERHLFAYSLSGSDQDVLSSTGTNGEAFPGLTSWRVDIPEWAQRVRIVCQFGGVRIDARNGNSYGAVWGRIGSVSNNDGFRTQETQFDAADRTGVIREAWMVADDVAVPSALRGTNQPVYTRGRLKGESGSGDARPKMDIVSSVMMDVEFYETRV